MRAEFAQAVASLASQPDFTFLTGDLGFMALEPVAAAARARFINAGVAEQNMVSIAAGLARAGLKPWVYSIAPFLYARPFEQIRNDVCHHDLPVCLVGNGGGYAYGVMGATHHAIEDYGALLTLPHLRAYVPAFAEDVAAIVERIASRARPAYLRLGRDERPRDFAFPGYAPWRRLRAGTGPVVVTVGPIAGSFLAELAATDATLWVVTELPVASEELPDDFTTDVRRADRLAVVEEHVAQGSVGQMLARALLLRGMAPRHYLHACALGYPSGTYGSQVFHRRECGLTPQAVLAGMRGWS